MDGGEIAWAVGAYAAGTFPSAYLVARVTHADDVIRAARRGSSEGDAHVLIDQRVSKAWGSVAAAFDVLKGFVYAILAKDVGHLTPEWLAAVGVLIVAGHTFPFYLRALAGRGLSAGSGVLLALSPAAMVAAGIIIVVGYVGRATGPASTLGFAVAPLVTLAVGETPAIAVMAACIFGVILLRRLSGLTAVAAETGWGTALTKRLVFDSDAPSRRAHGTGMNPATERPVQQ